MMNVPPSEANDLGLWEYQAMIYHWNKLHQTEPDGPSPAETQAMIDALKANPDMLKGKPKGEKGEPAHFNVGQRT